MLASQPLAYLGILGPQKRSDQLLSEAGVQKSTIQSLHSPMGLDIGADGPEQVALAVVAEIQATVNGREGGLLRDRQGPIHGTRSTGDELSTPYIRSIVCA
jgi:xanthine/CO dehydrogenase XdhC/CoxF family maturation factor